MMLVVAAIVFSEGVREEPILGRAVGSLGVVAWWCLLMVMVSIFGADLSYVAGRK